MKVWMVPEGDSWVPYMEGSGLVGPREERDPDSWDQSREDLDPWTFELRKPGLLGHRSDTVWSQEA